MNWKVYVPIFIVVIAVSLIFLTITNPIESFKTHQDACTAANNLPLFPGYPQCRENSKLYNTRQDCMIEERQECRECGGYADNTFEYKAEPGYWDVKWN
tara:strand:- start:398 stop:694 length:297 start_codon:yes stop_codon:yes gene_type:complete